MNSQPRATCEDCAGSIVPTNWGPGATYCCELCGRLYPDPAHPWPPTALAKQPPQRRIHHRPFAGGIHLMHWAFHAAGLHSGVRVTVRFASSADRDTFRAYVRGEEGVKLTDNDETMIDGVPVALDQ